MMDKIKANLNYVLCAFLGAFHFVMMSFNFISYFYKFNGEGDSNGIFNGYGMMNFGDFEYFDAKWIAIINGILQILLLIAAVGLLVYGVMGLLKAFGVFEQFPDKIGGFDSKKLASLAMFGYVAITALMFILLIIWGICNTESESYGGYKEKMGFRAGFGAYFALIFSGLIAATPIVLPKYVSGLNEETSGGPQIVYTCTNCGKRAPKGVRFCNACGGNVAASVVKQYNYICTGCGRKMKKTDRFCNVCGGAVQAVEIKQFEYICGGCGRKMKKTDRFCNACGGSVVRREIGAAAPVAAPAAPAAPVARGRVCPTCGKPVAQGQRFCTGCGTTL